MHTMYRVYQCSRVERTGNSYCHQQQLPSSDLCKMTDFTRRKLKCVDHHLSALLRDRVPTSTEINGGSSSPTSTSRTKIVTSLMLRGQSRQTRQEPCHSKWPLPWNWTCLGHCGLPGHPDCLPLQLNYRRVYTRPVCTRPVCTRPRFTIAHHHPIQYFIM